jgi:multiple sugar transport system substrate-binding protein
MKKSLNILTLTLVAILVSAISVSAEKTLKVWLPVDTWKKTLGFYEEHLDEFKKLHPDVEMEFVHIPYENYEAKYLTAFASREDAPDIFNGKVAYYAGAIGIADEAPSDLQELWNDKLLNTTKPFFQVDGKWHAYPTSTDQGMMVYYNVDHFKEAGLDPNKPPKTFQELLEYAKKLTKYDANGKIAQNGLALRYAGAPVGITDKILPFVHAFGGRLYAPDGSTADGFLNGPETIAAMQYLYDLVYTHKVSSLELGKPVETFAAGKAAMIFREGWLEGWMGDNAPDINYKVSALPNGPAGYPGLSLLFGWSWMVNNTSPDKDIAWDWIRTVSNIEMDLELAQLEGYLPVWEDNFKNPFVANRKDADATQVILSNPSGPYYDHPYINEIASKIGEQAQAVLYGANPEEAMNKAVKNVNKLLRKK